MSGGAQGDAAGVAAGVASEDGGVRSWRAVHADLHSTDHISSADTSAAAPKKPPTWEPRPPPLPDTDYKVILRIRGGLDCTKLHPCVLRQVVLKAVGLPINSPDQIRVNPTNHTVLLDRLRARPNRRPSMSGGAQGDAAGVAAGVASEDGGVRSWRAVHADLHSTDHISSADTSAAAPKKPPTWEPRPPPLPDTDYKVILRIRGGLDCTKLHPCVLRQVVLKAVGLPINSPDQIRVNPTNHTVLVSTSSMDRADLYHNIRNLKFDGVLYEVATS
ncbi:hypothetical protein HPB52_002158 [Rhipicephalus sanguineus]|uniref:Uncharacterized protein n=1 Tax=Rhipicephalus sanguineus TaxID=34632 RepID=A0A9D4Q6S0_RHISA|nr:hypothetical protein HPB52_002158 [Rhipicephalus sanguineus]